ncbi:hypothetical protein D3C87_785750 [compost metagenome]
MIYLFIIFTLLNFTNFFLLFQSESFILFISFFLIISYFYAFMNINLKSTHASNLEWIETVRFYITLSSWHKSYIRYNELKIANFYKLVLVLKKNFFLKLQKINKLLVRNHYNNLKKLQLFRLIHIERKTKLYKELVRTSKSNSKSIILIGSII